MERKLIITIDGPAGAGKSTLSRLLAERLNYTYIDSGALYRVVALQMQESGIDPDDDESLARMCRQLAISFNRRAGGLQVMADGKDVTDKIRAPAVSMLASRVSAKKVVRDALLDMQRRWGDEGGIVVEGRDMGTVVFPHAHVKFFLDASPEARGRRRCEQYREQGKVYDLDAIRRDMEKRDGDDAKRSLAPLKPADGAVMIDSTDMGIEEVVAEMLKAVGQCLSPASK